MNKIRIAFLSIMLSPLLIIATLTISNADEIRQFSSRHTLIDGTPVDVTVIGRDSEKGSVESAVSTALSNVRRLDSEMFAPGGFAEKLNSLKKAQPIELPPSLFNMIAKASVLSHQTEGWYDIASPSPNSWFSQRDWRRIALDDKAYTLTYKSADMKLDLKRISLAFFTDMLSETLLASGYNNFMVEIGPIRRYHGHNIFTPWNIQVGFGPDKTSQLAHRAQSFNLNDTSVATVTSRGLGRNLIDGRNKKIVEPNLMRSITILSNDAMTAEAFALAVYAVGPKYGMRYVDFNPAIKGIMVDNNGQIMASADLKSTNPNLISKWPEPSGKEHGPNNLNQKQREEEQDL